MSQPTPKRLRSWLLAIAAVWPLLSGCRELGLVPVGRTFEANFNLSAIGPAPSISGTPLFIETNVFATIGGRAGHHAAGIVALPDGDLLAAWYSYIGPHELDGSAIYLARRPAASQQWDAPELHIDRPIGDGNPVLYAKDDNVWLFQAVVPFGWSTCHVEFQKSTDAGHTWSPPQPIDGPLGTNVRNPPIRLHDGTLLLPAYDDLLGRSLCFTSTDGDAWTLVAEVSPPFSTAIQPTLIQMKDGRLIATMRNGGPDGLLIADSLDLGRTWSELTASGLPNPDSAATFSRLADGSLVLVYNDDADIRRPLSVAMSLDDGATWPLRRVLADGDETYSYPAVAQDPDGLIHVVFSVARRTIRHATFNAAWVAEAGN